MMEPEPEVDTSKDREYIGKREGERGGERGWKWEFVYF